jgi:hypothetical protein
MKTINKLDKPFGPAGTSAGLVLFFVGILTVSHSIFSFFLILIGAFFGFTTTSSVIDSDKKRVKLSNNLFGVLRIGKWINIEGGMKIGIRKSSQVWQTASWSNRVLKIRNDDFRVILFNFDEKEIIPLQKAISQNEASTELTKLSHELGLKTV